MDIYNVLLAIIGVVIVAMFSTLATRAEKAMWRKCRRRHCCRRFQEQITMGKAHCRRRGLLGRLVVRVHGLEPELTRAHLAGTQVFFFAGVIIGDRCSIISMQEVRQ